MPAYAFRLLVRANELGGTPVFLSRAGNVGEGLAAGPMRSCALRKLGETGRAQSPNDAELEEREMIVAHKEWWSIS